MNRKKQTKKSEHLERPAGSAGGAGQVVREPGAVAGMVKAAVDVGKVSHLVTSVAGGEVLGSRSFALGLA
jgi:hypothetical protein